MNKKRIKTKKEFIKFCKHFVQPILCYGSSVNGMLCDIWFMIIDINENKCYLPGCRLSNKEYQNGEIENYNNREDKLFKKYRIWMNELFKNNWKEEKY